MSNSTGKRVDNFLQTLKIHNKDLDICFNDALAVHHLKSLITSQAGESYKKGWKDAEKMATKIWVQALKTKEGKADD